MPERPTRARNRRADRPAVAALRSRGLDPVGRPPDLLCADRRPVSRRPGAAGGQTGARWKRRAYHVAIAPEPDTHRIAHLRQLTDALGLPFVPDLVCPQGAAAGPAPARALCGAARQPGLSLQALDRRGLARAGAGAGRARPDGGGDRRPGRGRAGLSRRPVGAGRARGRPAGRAARLAAARRAARGGGGLCRRRHLDEPSGGRCRMSHRCALRADQPAADRSLAGRAALPSPGSPPGPSSGAATSRWCRIRCPACRARSSAAPGTSTAHARCLDELIGPAGAAGGRPGARPAQRGCRLRCPAWWRRAARTGRRIPSGTDP